MAREIAWRAAMRASVMARNVMRQSRRRIWKETASRNARIWRMIEMIRIRAMDVPLPRVLECGERGCLLSAYCHRTYRKKLDL